MRIAMSDLKLDALFVIYPGPKRYTLADRIEFACRIDGRAWGPCSSPLTTDRLAVGTHEFDVYATDQAGNVEQEPAAFPFRIVSR